MEALFCGANTVASGLRAREYLGGYASFCEPDNVDSIKEAIKSEYYSSRPVLDEKIREEYTWRNAAEKTLEVYKTVLKRKADDTLLRKNKSGKKDQKKQI